MFDCFQLGQCESKIYNPCDLDLMKDHKINVNQLPDHCSNLTKNEEDATSNENTEFELFERKLETLRSYLKIKEFSSFMEGIYRKYPAYDCEMKKSYLSSMECLFERRYEINIHLQDQIDDMVPSDSDGAH